jgi:hypothetical protein
MEFFSSVLALLAALHYSLAMIIATASVTAQFIRCRMHRWRLRHRRDDVADG